MLVALVLAVVTALCSVVYQAVRDGLEDRCPSGWTELPDISP